MKRIAASLLLLVTLESAGQVSDRVVPVALGPWASGEVKALGEAAGAPKVEKFWERVREKKTPVVERDPADKSSILVTFLARAPAGYRYPVPGVHGTYGWHDLYRLENVAGTDIWMRTIRFPAATRTAYWLTSPRGRVADPEAIDIFSVFADRSTPSQEVYTDPLSGYSAPYFNTATGTTVGRYSWFEGPDAPPEPFLTPQSKIASGSVTTRVVKSALLGNSRDVSIYTPPGYKKGSGRDYPLLLVFDRDEYLATVQVPSLLDAMIHAQAVPPVVAVFVDVIGYAERGRELPGDPTFQRFIQEELLPPLEREFGLTKAPAQRVVAGCSYGGLAATLIARRYPQSFGAVVSQSGAFARVPPSAVPSGAGRPEDYGEVARLFADGERLPIRFAIDVGLLERDGMIQSNRHMRDVLLAKGYAVDYSEFMGAHDWIGWRGSFPARLTSVLAPGGRSLARP